MAKELTPEAQVRRTLLSLPGCISIKSPIPTGEDRKNAAFVLQNFKPFVAELVMERMVDGLVSGDASGLAYLKVMAPYMFKKEAQTVEMKTLDGDASPESLESLEAYLKADRLEQMDTELEQDEDDNEDQGAGLTDGL